MNKNSSFKRKQMKTSDLIGKIEKLMISEKTNQTLS